MKNKIIYALLALLLVASGYSFYNNYEQTQKLNDLKQTHDEVYSTLGDLESRIDEISDSVEGTYGGMSVDDMETEVDDLRNTVNELSDSVSDIDSRVFSLELWR